MRHKSPKLVGSAPLKDFAKTCAGPAKRTRVANGNSTKVSVCAQQRECEVYGELLVAYSGKLYCRACSALMDNEHGCQQLRLELAVIIDAVDLFVTSTHLLEGDCEPITTADE